MRRGGGNPWAFIAPGGSSGDRRASSDELAASAEQRLNSARGLTVEAVVIDFHSATPGLLVPLSWKLTNKQKQNIDKAWRLVVQGNHPQQPIATLDRFFQPRLPNETDER